MQDRTMGIRPHIQLQIMPVKDFIEIFLPFVSEVSFESQNMPTHFESFFESNFLKTIKELERKITTLQYFITAFKNQEWTVEHAQMVRLAESFDINEYHEDFTDEACANIDEIFTVDNMHDVHIECDTSYDEVYIQF
jgi:hypothetical protein